MLIAFQIILISMIILLVMGTIAEKDSQDKQTCGMVASVAIAAMAVTIIF